MYNIYLVCISKGCVDQKKKKKIWRLVTLKYTGPIPFAATGMRYYRGEKNKCPRRTYHWPYGRRLFGVVVFFIFILNLLLVIFRILSDRQIYALEIKKIRSPQTRKKTLFFTKDSPYLRNINNSIAGAKLNEPSRIFFDNTE